MADRSLFCVALGMKFPVDLLADASQAELEQSAHNYMNNLLHSNPDCPEHLTLPDSSKVNIEISNVGLVPLYGCKDEQKILGLFSPSNVLTAVALYLLDQWWTVDEILKTADPARDGVVEVQTIGERIVLYILNRVIYRAKEMSSEEELPFLCHGEKDYAKIHWSNGEAVGFYSVKPSGSLCNYFSTRSYQLPVMDSIFVRKCHRGKGFGLHMLENFVLSFKEEHLGLRYPLTKAMYKVCGKYLRQYPEDTDLLWEVESVGGPNQRTNIASKIQTMDLSAVSKNLSFMEESLVTGNDVVMEAITTQIKETGSVECTVEIVEEVTVRRTTKEADDVPVTARGRSSGSKRQKTGEKITRDKSEKVIRIEDIEAETPTEERVSELVQTDTVLSVATEENAEDEVDDAAEESAQNLEQAEVTSAPTAEESQVEDGGIKDLSDTSCDALITVENVASELEEAEEEIQEEDTAVLVVSEDVLEVCKEGETLDKVEETTQGKVSDESSEETLSLSTHATSEGGEARKVGRPLGKTIKTIQSETPRRRSQRLSKPEFKEETTAQDDKKVLRGRTVVNSPAIQRKYHRHSQKVCEELDKEVNKVTEEKVLEGSTATEGQEAEEIAAREENAVIVEEIAEEEKLEQLINEEETERHEDTGMEESAIELPGTQEIEENALTKVKEDEKVTQAEMSVIEDKDEESDDEIEEPPVVQRRALRERRKATPKPKPIKQSKKQQQQEEADEEVQKHTQVEQDKMTDKPEEESEEATAVGEGDASKAGEEEDIISLAEVNLESKVVQDASETVMLEKSRDETVSEELHENNTGSEIPKLQEKEQMEPEAAERDVSTSVAEEQTPEPEKLAVEEEEGGTQEKITAEEETAELKEDSSEKEKEEIPNVDNTETEVEEALVIETRVLQSGRKTVKASRRSTRSKQQQERDEAGEDIAEEEAVDVVEVEGEVEAVAEKLPAVSETDADAVVDIPAGHDAEENLLPTEVDEAVNLDEEQASVVETRALRNRTKTVTSTPSNKTVAENSEIEEATVTTRSLRRGKISISATPKSRRTRKQIQEAEDEEAGQEAAIEKTDKQMEAKPEEEMGEETKMEAETSEPEAEVEEGKAVSEEAVSEQEIGEEQSEVISKTLDMAIEKGMPEEDTMTTTEEEKSIAGEEATADDVEREGETDPPSTKPAADSAIPTTCEEEAPSGVEQQIKEAQLSDLPRVTVVLVDVEKTYHEVQEETAIVEEGSKEKTAAEGEDEQKELMEEEQEAEENVPGSPVGAGETEQEEMVAQEEGQGEKVEEVVTVHSTEEGSAEETAKVDEAKSADEEEESAGIKTKTHRSGKEAVKATARRKSARNRKDELQQKVEETVSENSEEEPAARVLRRGRKSAPATPRRKSKRARTQPETEEEAEESAPAVETEEEEAPVAEARAMRRVTRGRQTTKIQDEEAGLGLTEKPLTEDDEGKATEDVEKEECVAVEVEEGLSEGATMTTTEEEESTAGEEAAADDAERERETDPPSTKPAADSAIPTTCEEEAPSGEEQQSKEAQLSDLPRVTVVLVDVKKTYHEVQEETAIVEEGSKEKTAAEGEDEQKELMEEEQEAEENVPGSPVGAGETEQEEMVAQEEGQGEKVEDVVTVHSTEEGSAEETAKVDETKSADEEEEPAGIKTKTHRSGKEAVKATARRKSARNRKDELQQKVEETVSENSEEEPAARVLRGGRKSVPATQRRATTRTQKRHQEEEGGEESTAVEEREAKEQEEEAGEQAGEQQQMTDQEKGEGLDQKDMNPQVENLGPDMSAEKEDTVAEEAVTTSEINEEAETPAGESAGEGETLEEAAVITIQDTEETEQSTSITEVDDTAAGESTQGGKTVRATTRRQATKIQDEEAAGEKSTEEDEPTVETRVLRRGRKSAPATPRRKSKRARTQSETEEEAEQETAPAEEIQAEETKADQREDDQDQKIDEKVEEQKEENSEAEAEMEEVQPVAEVSLTEQDTVEEEPSAIAETSADQQGETVVGESAEETPPTDETVAINEEEETPVVETRALSSGGKTERATRIRQTTTIQDEEAGGEKSTEEDEPTVETRVLRRGRKSAPATPRRKSKRARTQPETEEEAEESAPAVETEEEEEEAGQVSHEEKAEGEANSMEKVEQTAIDATEDQAEETADMVDDPIVEPADEETATEERQSPEEELSGSEENKTMGSKGSRSLRTKTKTDGDEEESPQRRSMRKRPRVDYRENEEEGDVNIAINEVEEEKVESDVPKDIKEAEEESKQEGNVENNIVANESTSEKGDILNLVLETDEEVEATGVSQEVEEDEQNISEEEKEPIVIGKRALRGRSVPSVVITPGPKSKRSSTKVHESLSDEESEKSQPAPRSLRKRKASPTPTRKSKRHSRV
ncbi:trichohyalin-like [Scomber scombrus]|uniref:Trichohyalin-like n=1 Tax=Scomber scombrus TaxID=13677 RepID=A0AAV1NIZ8_SCOSC